MRRGALDEALEVPNDYQQVPLIFCASKYVLQRGHPSPVFCTVLKTGEVSFGAGPRRFQALPSQGYEVYAGLGISDAMELRSTLHGGQKAAIYLEAVETGAFSQGSVAFILRFHLRQNIV